MGSKPKPPKPPKQTPEEKAMERRTEIGLREERARTERMLKAQARSQLGAQSLLVGIEPEASGQESVKHSGKNTNKIDTQSYAEKFSKLPRSIKKRRFRELTKKHGLERARELTGNESL